MSGKIKIISKKVSLLFSFFAFGLILIFTVFSAPTSAEGADEVCQSIPEGRQRTTCEQAAQLVETELPGADILCYSEGAVGPGPIKYDCIGEKGSETVFRNCYFNSQSSVINNGGSYNADSERVDCQDEERRTIKSCRIESDFTCSNIPIFEDDTDGDGVKDVVDNDDDNDGIDDAVDDDDDNNGIPDEEETDCTRKLSEQGVTINSDNFERASKTCECAAQYGESIEILDSTQVTDDGEGGYRCLNRGGPCSGINIIIGWIVCPIVEAMDGVITNVVDKVLEDLLVINFDEDNIRGLGEGAEGTDLVVDMKKMWGNVKNMTNALFVILFVIAILGHVTGAVEAYTAKKIIPRIVIAAILTQLSWFISTELSAIFDDIGRGIGDLIEKDLLDGEEITLKTIIGGESAVQGGVFLAIAALYPIGIFTVLLFALAAAWAIFIGFLTLIIRKVVLIAIVIASPLALTLWAIPATDKWAKRWFDWYIRLLVMYPFIEVLIAVGKVTARVLAGGVEGSETENGERDWLFVIAAVMVYLAPYAFLPTALKIATSTIGNLTGFMNDKGSGLYDGARSWLGGERDKSKAFKADRARLGYAKTDGVRKGYREGGLFAGSINAINRGRHRARSGAALPTRYNKTLRDDIAHQASEKHNRERAASLNRRELGIESSAQPIILNAKVEAVIQDTQNRHAAGIDVGDAGRLVLDSADDPSAQRSAAIALLNTAGIAGKTDEQLAADGFGNLSASYATLSDGTQIKNVKDAVVAHKVALANASTGSTITDLAGNTFKVEEGDKHAAIASLIANHLDSADAAAGVTEFFKTGQTTSDKAHQRASQQLMQEHGGTLKQKLPQAIYGGNATTTLQNSSSAAIAQLYKGAQKDLLKRAVTDSDVNSYMRSYVEELTSGREAPTLASRQAVLKKLETHFGSGSAQLTLGQEILGADGTKSISIRDIQNALDASSAGSDWR